MNEENPSSKVRFRAMEEGDNGALASLILEVLASEFGESEQDVRAMFPELDSLHRHYNEKGAWYLVAVEGTSLLGGAGCVARDDGRLCELQKMYLRASSRGQGLGRRLLLQCIERARFEGFEGMCLVTRGDMKEARALYEDLGFVRVGRPVALQGYALCDAYYELRFREAASQAR